jgi:hypothetical protein
VQHKVSLPSKAVFFLFDFEELTGAATFSRSQLAHLPPVAYACGRQLLLAGHSSAAITHPPHHTALP